MIPDDVLLEIFDFYVDDGVDEDFKPFKKRRLEEWMRLAHLCRRWRSVVFQSPRRLKLGLVCTTKTPARETLDIWPPLPLIIHGSLLGHLNGTENIIAALEHNDRVCQINLEHVMNSGVIMYWQCVMNSAAMQKPFPELTDLRLGMFEPNGSEPILPDSFLSGTAPRLRSFQLDGVPFPGLPKLLLSATHLVHLELYDIPISGYIPPEEMATSFSALTSLESLRFGFRHPRPRPALESRRPPPPPLTRSILPSLTEIGFKGASEYLEVILARIDAPRLNKMRMTFFNQIIFDLPQLFQFIGRTPTLGALEKGHITFNPDAIDVTFPPQTSDHGALGVRILCIASDWQLSALEQVCTSSLPPVSMLENLYISKYRRWGPRWQGEVEYTLWLDLLRSFVAVKKLYLSEECVPLIAPALQELAEGQTTELLPTLEIILLEEFQPSGHLHEGIKKFVAARRLTGHPVAVSRWWDRDTNKEMQWGPYEL